MKKFTFLSIAMFSTLLMFATTTVFSQNSNSNLKVHESTYSSTTVNHNTDIEDVIDFSVNATTQKDPVNNTQSPLLVNELNTPNEAQSYPWLSDDALRVYYTQGTEMYMASRVDPKAKFNKGQAIFPLIKETVISGWLTPDELNIYIASQSSKLYIATRTNRNENFSSYKEVTLKNAPGGSLFDASFTPDMYELLMYNNDNRERIVKFIKTGENEYTFSEELNVMSKETPTGGQLSRDGLRFYVPFKRTVNNNDDYRYIYVLTRKGMHDNFNGIEQVKSIEVINITAYQPTINADETEMIFVTGADNIWDNNELCSIELVKEITVSKVPAVIQEQKISPKITEPVVVTDPPKVKENVIKGIIPIETAPITTAPPKPASINMRIAPNPFNEQTTIEITAPEGGFMVVQAYSMDGQLVANLYTGESQKGINIISWVKNGLSNGVYTVKATVGKTATNKKVVICGTN